MPQPEIVDNQEKYNSTEGFGVDSAIPNFGVEKGATTAVLTSPGSEDSHSNSAGIVGAFNPSRLTSQDSKPSIPEPAFSSTHAQTEQGLALEGKVLTPSLLPILGVERGCLAIAGGNFAGVIKMSGINSRLLSAVERQAYVRRMEALFNASGGPFSFYASVRPHNLDQELKELKAKLEAENNPALHQQYYLQLDHLERLSQEHNLTRRDYYATVQVGQADLKALQTGEQEKLSFGQRVKGNFLAAFGSEDRPNPSNRGNKQGQELVPPPIAGQTLFRSNSFAEGLRDGARVLDTAEIVQLLGRLCESQTVGNNLGHSFSSERGQQLSIERAEAVGQIGGVSFKEQPDYLKLGDTFVASLYITDFPRWLHLGSLFEILRLREVELDLALHATPLDNTQAEEKLKNRESLLLAVKASDATATGDAHRNDRIEGLHELRKVLARGDARIFRAGIRLCVRAKTKKRLFADLQRVSQRLAELGFKAATPLRNQRRAFLSCLPFGVDLLAKEKFISDRTIHPNLTGQNLACLLPNLIIDATMPRGIPLGIEKASGGFFTFNRWAREQIAPHTVISAFTGAGKSISQALEILLELLRDPILEAFFIDPQGQVSLRLAQMVGGTVVDLGASGNACFNPLDRYSLAGREEGLAEKLEYLVPLLELMMRAELTATEKSALTRAVKRLYSHFEEGESWVSTLYQNFATFPLYAPLRPYLLDWTDEQGQSQAGVMSQLARIYVELRLKFKIPASGLVRGVQVNGKLQRAICKLSGNRWYYAGEGETDDPLEAELSNSTPETNSFPANSANPVGVIPAAVWYPENNWFQALQLEFERQVGAAGLFGQLDRLAARAAVRDAFTELSLGMPILSDILPALVAEGLPNLANNLDQFVDPAILGPLFNGYTNVDFSRYRFVAFNCLGLNEEVLKTTRIFQVINYLWGMAKVIRKRRLLVADEFQLMMETFGSVAQFIKLLFMRGRAFGFAITAIVQNISAFLDNPDGRVCIELASRIVLMKQQRGAEHRLRSHFGLTDGQVEALLNAVPGEALVLTNKGWIHMQNVIPKERLKQFETNLPEG